MLTYAIYNTTSGAITKVISIDDADILSIPANTGVGEASSLETTVDPDNYYYVGATKTARVSLDTICTFTNSGSVWNADGSDTIVYGSALPNPSTATVSCAANSFADYGVITITDGTLTLTTTVVGDYTIVISSFPYLDKTITVSAV